MRFCIFVIHFTELLSRVNSVGSGLLLTTLPPWTGIKLREANQQQQFNRNVEDIELWLYEVEGHLASDDYGKDLTNVQNLQKKHALLEADVAAHQVGRDPAGGCRDGHMATLVWGRL